MQINRSPPKKSNMGGSKATTLSTSTTSVNMTNRTIEDDTCSAQSLYSNESRNTILGARGEKNLYYTNNQFYNHHQYQQHAHHHHHHHHGGGKISGSLTSSNNHTKRGKKQNWNSRGRAGMSFMIVIAFFAVFGLIILSELFMIDERSHGFMLHHGGNLGSRLGDSMPDYDNVKDDYDLLDENLLNVNKLGFVQFQDNKLKIQDADNSGGSSGRLAGTLLNSGAANAFGAAAINGIGSNNADGMAWGKIFPNKIEETLPHYPIGLQPTDGSWQIVNGTRFKFFVFSAYYDRRDGAKLIRIIGATKTRGPERVWCRFWYKNNTSISSVRGEGGQRQRYTSATMMARVKIIRENWNLKYSACFVLCPIHRSSELPVPQYVSIVARLRSPPGNLLLLRNTDWDADFSMANNIDNTSLSTASHNFAGMVTNASSSIHSQQPAKRHFPRDEEIADKIAVCVKPFHFDYDQPLYLMEYLEFYSILGVSHFTFYNHTIGPHATCVLQHYMSGNIPGNLTAWDEEVSSSNADSRWNTADTSKNHNNISAPSRHMKSTNYVKPTISILPWNLRMRSQKEIRTEGLFAALNDCLYRTMYRFKYLALVDLDEFIVPRYNDTIIELINSLNGRFRNRNAGAYSFQNAFFYLQFPDDPLTSQNILNRLRVALMTQRKTRRRFKLHPQKQRSKYICKPEAVVEAGNHFVWEFAPGKGTLNVPPTDGILQHYRVCEFGGNDCVKAPSVVDRTATRYVNRLEQRVDTVYKYLKKTCNLPDLSAITKATAKQQQIQQQVNTNQLNNDLKMRRETKKTNTNVMMNTTSIKFTKTNHTTTTYTNATRTTIPVSDRNVATESDDVANYKKRHKVVIFERDENGVMGARVEFVDN